VGVGVGIGIGIGMGAWGVEEEEEEENNFWAIENMLVPSGMGEVAFVDVKGWSTSIISIPAPEDVEGVRPV